jgi:hypothetical protein
MRDACWGAVFDPTDVQGCVRKSTFLRTVENASQGREHAPPGSYIGPIAASAAYGEELPLLNSGLFSLLDNRRAIAQMASLERRTSCGGKDSIDHPPGGRDDIANVIAGAARFL